MRGRLSTHDVANGIGDCVDVSGIHKRRMGPDGLSKDGNIAGENPTTNAGRLDRRKAEAFVQRQADKQRAMLVEPFQVCIADSPDDSPCACRGGGPELVIQVCDSAGRLSNHDQRKVLRQHPRAQRGAQCHREVLPDIEAADAQQILSV